jgi:hypothetical protein
VAILRARLAAVSHEPSSVDQNQRAILRTRWRPGLVGLTRSPRNRFIAGGNGGNGGNALIGFGGNAGIPSLPVAGTTPGMAGTVGAGLLNILAAPWVVTP